MKELKTTRLEGYNEIYNDIKFLLYRTVQFYKTYAIMSTLSTQLSWSHLSQQKLIADVEVGIE